MSLINGKKQFLASMLCGRYSPIESVLSMRGHRHVTVLAYHRIFPKPQSNYPFVKGVINVDQNVFDDQLKILKKYFTIINFEQLRHIQAEKTKLPKNLLIITFDDGYEDNFSQMTPVIKAHDSTAVVYISTEYIEQQKLFWVDELSFKINKMPEGEVSFLDGKVKYNVTNANRNQVRVDIGNVCKGLTRAGHRKLLEDLRSQVNIEPSVSEFDQAKPMTWDQMTAMCADGIEIGSHAKFHGYLNSMTDEELRDEIYDSKAILEQKIGKEVISIAYPGGRYDERTLKIVAAAGYTYGCSFTHGIGEFNESIRYKMPRLIVDNNISNSQFKSMLMLPELF